jgi:NTE family protein
MKYDYGIVLSGGGARGIAHLGILKALEELGIKPAVISGTSSGAIAGAFYANGFGIDEILSIIKNGHFFNFSNLNIVKQGLFSMKGFDDIYKTYFKTNSFEDLKIPLYIAATDILKGEINYFSEGELSTALLASSCIPVLFHPIRYRGNYYVDGGILNNFPIEPLLNKCNKIIGINVNSINKEIHDIHMKNVLDRCFHLALNSANSKKFAMCNLYIEPPKMSQFGILDLDKIDLIYDYGYQYGLSLESKINELINSK